jgi:hypothetical protein
VADDEDEEDEETPGSRTMKAMMYMIMQMRVEARGERPVMAVSAWSL